MTLTHLFRDLPESLPRRFDDLFGLFVELHNYTVTIGLLLHGFQALNAMPKQIGSHGAML